MVQDRAKSGLEARNSFNSWKRRMLTPSRVVYLLASETVDRCIQDGIAALVGGAEHQSGPAVERVTTAIRENTTRAKGREKRAKMMPANSAMIRMPVKLSTVTRILV